MRLYDSEKLLDEGVLREAAESLDYPELDSDLRLYISDKSRGIIVRRVAINFAEMCRRTALEPDLAAVALDEHEPHDVRVASAFAVSRMGTEACKAALRPLVTDPSINDPDDELKGCALAATWPRHLSGAELFSALEPEKRSNLSGTYALFLRSDVAAHIRLEDMCAALDWARNHTGTYREVPGLSYISAQIVTRAVDYTEVAGVAERLAELLPKRALKLGREPNIIARLRENQFARQRIAKVFLASSGDVDLLLYCGLITPEDVAWLLSELNACAPAEKQVVASLIRRLLDPNDVDSFALVVQAAKQDAVLGQELAPCLEPVFLDSPRAQELKKQYERDQEQARQISQPQPELTLDDLIAKMNADTPGGFYELCSGLYERYSIPPKREAERFPGWSELASSVRGRVLEAAELYLRRWEPVDRTWVRTGSIPRTIMFGYWALRLLRLEAPAVLENLSDAIWRNWCGCVVGYPFAEAFAEDSYSDLLEIAYERASVQCSGSLQALIDGEDERPDLILRPERFAKVWNETIATVLRSNLTNGRLQPSTLGTVLGALLEHKDAPAHEFALSLARPAMALADSHDEKGIAAARQLLLHDPTVGWEIVWPAVEKGSDFGRDTLTALAQAGRELIVRNPEVGWPMVWPAVQEHASLAHEFFLDLPWVDSRAQGALHPLLPSLRESQLAELYVWLAEHSMPLGDEARGLIRYEKSLHFTSHVVITNLADRATPEACEQIRRLKELLNDDTLKWHLKHAEEGMYRMTWKLLLPKELITLVCNPPTCTPVEAAAETQHTAPANSGEDWLFRKEGDVWNLSFAGTSVYVKHSNGMGYIASLLGSPGRQVHSLELYTLSSGARGDRNLSKKEKKELSAVGRDQSAVLDPKAFQQYRQRLKDIGSELATAQQHNDPAGKERLQKEREWIEGELSRAAGLGGRSRNFSDEAERTRQRVSRAIARAITAIRKNHPALAVHLKRHIECGSILCYKDDGSAWILM